VVFTHRVEAGASDRSYGIHVARLAGIPRGVIDRAKEILGNLESDAYGRDGLPRLSRTGETGADYAVSNSQTSLFPMMRSEPAAASPLPDDPDPAAESARGNDADGGAPVAGRTLPQAEIERDSGDSHGVPETPVSVAVPDQKETRATFSSLKVSNTSSSLVRESRS